LQSVLHLLCVIHYSFFVQKGDKLSQVIANEVELNKRVDTGTTKKSTLREHLQIAVPDHPLLKQEELDEYDSYYMFVFSQLNRSRIYEQGYPFQLSLSVFNDYMKLFNDELTEDEVLLLQYLDAAFLDAIAKRDSNDNTKL
jgi:hypothetical protein